MQNDRIRYVVIGEGPYTIHDLAQPKSGSRKWNERVDACNIADRLNYWLNFGG
jgi:hypothetical protein